MRTREIWSDFSKSRMGLAGIGILLSLFCLSLITVITVPDETFREWNNPSSWITYPKTSQPAWMNYFSLEKIPEHKILKNPQESSQTMGEISTFSQNFAIEYNYDGFPSDFIYEYSAKYSGSPLLQLSVTRPDGVKIDLISRSLPQSDGSIYSEQIFSTDDSLKKNLRKLSTNFDFPTDLLSAEDIVFSRIDQNSILKGKYIFHMKFYNVNSKIEMDNSRLIIGGKVYGLIGTDDLRRDLAVGILWGTPLALFVGISVAIGSVIIGLVYGVYAGYKGKKTDEALMRFNDVIISMPGLPLLIILAVTLGNNIFLIVGFLMIFGWVGTAKISRSMAIQIKTLQYVEASKIMGQKDIKIIFKHIIPQLLPFTFASIAISVPSAITTEAALSFLGLGDPTFPTWGQILHDANSFGAAARGLWWWILPPGVMIAITGLAFVFIGNAMDKIANPRLKR
ncbi:MAG TPA: ABC transporter permease [Nitrosopumilaceae archaeon]|nr:ABC transporter permease [Nitrosopumilaceae archaeon]